MTKTLVFLLLFAGLALAQTPPPPALLPNLPPNVSQEVITSASTSCGSHNPHSPCVQIAGSNLYLVQHGGTGGVHYDAAGNVFIGVFYNNQASTQELTSLSTMAQDGTFTQFLSVPLTSNNCTQTSPTSITAQDGFILSSNFSINPANNTLYVVTQHFVSLYTWNPSITTAVCNSSGIVTFSGSQPNAYTEVTLNTYALIAVSGSGI